MDEGGSPQDIRQPLDNSSVLQTTKAAANTSVFVLLVWGIGGPCRDRTYDQEIKSLLLYQLS
jgi:hypothetical protein